MTKLRDRRGGANRALVTLSILILVMVGIISVPTWKAFRYRSECIACEQAMKSAGDGLIIEFLNTYKEDSIKGARKTLDEVMPARDDICPTHGNVYLIKEDENGIYEPVCGLHNGDAKLRTRLNASYAGNQLNETRRKILLKAKEGAPEPEFIALKVNGKTLECGYVTEKPNIRRGTASTKGYDGVVAFYGTNDKNEVNYFVYADEDHCAIWTAKDGWSGDAYEGI